jgi:diacylglycerol kinase (ATP)
MLFVLLARSISEEFSSGDRDTKPLSSRGDSESETVQAAGTSSQSSSSKSQDREREKDKERDEETIKVYDGNQGVRRRQFRPIHASKSATTEQVLSSALKAFHITKPTENYYLTDAYDDESTVQDPNPVQSLKRREGKRPAVFLRFR